MSQDPPYPRKGKDYELSFPCPDDDYIRNVKDEHKMKKEKAPQNEHSFWGGAYDPTNRGFSNLLDPARSNLPSGAGYSSSSTTVDYPRSPGADPTRQKRKSRLEVELDSIFDNLNNDLMIHRRRSETTIGGGGGLGPSAVGRGRRSLFDNSFFGPEDNKPSGYDSRQRSYGADGGPPIRSIFDQDFNDDWRRKKKDDDKKNNDGSRNIPVYIEGDTDNRPGYDGGERITSIFGGGDNKPTYPPSEPYKPYKPSEPYVPTPKPDPSPYVPPPTITRPDPEPYVPPPAISKSDPEPYVPKIGGGAVNDDDGVQLRNKNKGMRDGDSTLIRRSKQHIDDQHKNLKHFNNDTRYDNVVRNCALSRSPWEDPNFEASNRVLVSSNQPTSIFTYGGRGISGSSIQWLRPHDICQQLNLGKDPVFFGRDVDRFDINQGEIGNCWFLAALANLAENRDIFNLVVPPNQDFQQGYSGAFRFRFWRFGEWTEVVIDDRLPTRSGNLIYIRSREKNEFWSALLEKAYAKLHGSYRALEGGLTIEAAVDFTGGIPELIDLTTTTMSQLEIFHLMKKSYDRGAFLGCALGKKQNIHQAQERGLQPRHAYTISKVVELKGNVGRAKKTAIPLVRIRNPHGDHKEWNGAWSDDDHKWNSIDDNIKAKLELTKKADGEFYMHFRDFLEYYGELEICHLGPDSFAGKEESGDKFEAKTFTGRWKAGVNSGGCGNDGFYAYSKNPQYFIELTDPDPYDDQSRCPVVISLAQRQEERKKELAIGFKVYKCQKGQTSLSESFMRSNNSHARTDSFINLREVSKRLMLPPGRFCIIPSTFAQNEEGEFMLRVYVEKHWSDRSVGEMPAQVDNRFSRLDGGEDATDQAEGVGKKRNKSKLEALYSWASTESTEDKVLRDIIKSFPEDMQITRAETRRVKKKKNKD